MKNIFFRKSYDSKSIFLVCGFTKLEYVSEWQLKRKYYTYFQIFSVFNENTCTYTRDVCNIRRTEALTSVKFYQMLPMFFFFHHSDNIMWAQKNFPRIQKYITILKAKVSEISDQ